VQQAIDNNPDVIEAQETIVKARAGARVAKLDYLPEVAGVFGYSNQNLIPILPSDFSFYGFMATWTVFDFGKRERTISERNTQVRMAEANLQLVRSKVAASVQKASLDMQRTRRIMQLTRQVAAMKPTARIGYASSLEERAAQAQSDIEMYQAELDYRAAVTEWKRMMGIVR
jgi:outer membrane protein TolC